MDVVDDDACCKTCDQFAGKDIDPIERETMDGPLGKFKVVLSDGRELPAKHEMIVGRTSQADIQLRDDAISRKQARLVFQDDAVYIEDLQSACGTFVDGQRVGRERLKRGAMVQFANSWLRVIER